MANIWWYVSSAILEMCLIKRRKEGGEAKLLKCQLKAVFITDSN
jgi:hypothetical protein